MLRTHAGDGALLRPPLDRVLRGEDKRDWQLVAYSGLPERQCAAVNAEEGLFQACAYSPQSVPGSLTRPSPSIRMNGFSYAEVQVAFGEEAPAAMAWWSLLIVACASDGNMRP
jgi:hypothetical protein